MASYPVVVTGWVDFEVDWQGVGCNLVVRRDEYQAPLNRHVDFPLSRGMAESFASRFIRYAQRASNIMAEGFVV
jgi:hypothetical protein